MRTVGRFRLTKQLGVGMFSKVMLGTDKDTNEQYAVKVMRKDSLEEMGMARYARQEAAILRKLSHPNIVGFVEAIQNETRLFLVMEIAPGNELLEVVARGPLTENDGKVYMRQLVSAVSYLHSNGIVHRDLKPENVLVDVNTKTLKIIDFGLTGSIRKNDVMRTSCGSNYYSAPEVTYTTGDGYDGIKADAWSLGILSYIILTGSHPFIDSQGGLMTAMMRQGIVEYPDSLSQGAIHFISRLLAIDPRRRYSVGQVGLHPWLTGKPVPRAGHSEDLRDRPKKDHDTDVRRFGSKRPGTFSGGYYHRSLFGRTHSHRNNQSSPSLATRRRSSHKHSSGSFLWFRRGNSLQENDNGEEGIDRNAGVATGSRRGSLDRTKGGSRESRITIDFMASMNNRGVNSHNGADSADNGSRVRRQLSLSSRTKALLMRSSQTSEQQ